MSEANNVWQVETEGQKHQVRLEHFRPLMKPTVVLDGVTLKEERLLFRKKSISFNVGGHPAVVTTEFRYLGFSVRSSMRINGRDVEPGRT